MLRLIRKKVNEIMMIEKEGMKLFHHTDGNFNIIFSTAENNLSFKLGDCGEEKINEIKRILNLDDVYYLSQTHSSNVIIAEGNCAPHGNIEGDAIITSKKNIAVGVFTADCVPILLWDEEKRIIASVHSGWRGTFDKITKEAVKTMKEKYGCLGENIKAYIGPHIMDCCYEVSEELKEKFLKDELYKNIGIFQERNLNLQKCIEAQLIDEGIAKEKIYCANLCTYCSNTVKLHSYRKDNLSSGRLLSLIFIK